MNWPLVHRSWHNSIVNALVANLEVRAEYISALKAIIAEQRAEIKLLKLTEEAKKCNDYTSQAPEKRKMPEPVLPARAGWRARAQMASEATIPVTGDSAKQLEAKVLREGGTIEGKG